MAPVSSDAMGATRVVHLYEFGNLASAKRSNLRADSLDGPIPPSDPLKGLNLSEFETRFQYLRRVSPDYVISRNIARHDRPRTDHRAISDADARENRCPVAYPDIVADFSASLGARVTILSRKEISKCDSERKRGDPLGIVLAAAENTHALGYRAKRSYGDAVLFMPQT